MFYIGKRFSPAVLLSIGVVVAGVGVVTVTDVAVKASGLIVALIFVVTSGLQQIICGSLQRKHNVTSNQLLSNLAPIQGTFLLLTGPFVDKMVRRWLPGCAACGWLARGACPAMNVPRYLLRMAGRLLCCGGTARACLAAHRPAPPAPRPR
jgi:hypothetical protein